MSNQLRPESILFVVDAGQDMKRMAVGREPLIDSISRAISNFVDLKLSFKMGNQFSLAYYDDEAGFRSICNFTDDKQNLERCISSLPRLVNQGYRDALNATPSSPFSFSSIFSWLTQIMAPAKQLVHIIVVNVRQANVPFVDSEDKCMRNFLNDTKNCLIDFVNIIELNPQPDSVQLTKYLWPKVERLGNIQLCDCKAEQVEIYNRFALLLAHPDYFCRAHDTLI